MSWNYDLEERKDRRRKVSEIIPDSPRKRRQSRSRSPSRMQPMSARKRSSELEEGEVLSDDEEESLSIEDSVKDNCVSEEIDIHSQESKTAETVNSSTGELDLDVYDERNEYVRGPKEVLCVRWRNPLKDSVLFGEDEVFLGTASLAELRSIAGNLSLMSPHGNTMNRQTWITEITAAVDALSAPPAAESVKVRFTIKGRPRPTSNGESSVTDNKVENIDLSGLSALTCTESEAYSIDFTESKSHSPSAVSCRSVTLDVSQCVESTCTTTVTPSGTVALELIESKSASPAEALSVVEALVAMPEPVRLLGFEKFGVAEKAARAAQTSQDNSSTQQGAAESPEPAAPVIETRQVPFEPVGIQQGTVHRTGRTRGGAAPKKGAEGGFISHPLVAEKVIS